MKPESEHINLKVMGQVRISSIACMLIVTYKARCYVVNSNRNNKNEFFLVGNALVLSLLTIYEHFWFDIRVIAISDSSYSRWNRETYVTIASLCSKKQFLFRNHLIHARDCRNTSLFLALFVAFYRPCTHFAGMFC